MIGDLTTLPKTARYSATECARLLGCTVRTIANYRIAGKLRARVNRNNGRYYYTGAELQRFWRIM